MFRRLPDTLPAAVNVTIEGKPWQAQAGESVAAALFASGHLYCRTTAVSHARRAPYCLMGVCFDCLVSIDGVANRQACMTSVREGMRIELQHGKRELTA